MAKSVDRGMVPLRDTLSSRALAIWVPGLLEYDRYILCEMRYAQHTRILQIRESALREKHKPGFT